MAEATLTCPLINGGTAVNMKGISVSYGWSNLTKTDPVPGKFDITEADVGGFESPAIVIEGVIDINSSESDTMTHSLLMDFAQVQYDGASGTTITLAIPTGDATPVYLKGRPSTGYSVGGTYINSLKVIITSFSIRFDTSSKNGHIWRYSINLIETI